MEHNIYLYILVAASVSCLIRVLPLTLIYGLFYTMCRMSHLRL